jgi:hypothetical protein
VQKTQFNPVRIPGDTGMGIIRKGMLNLMSVAQGI